MALNVVSEQSFEAEVLGCELPVLIEFFAGRFGSAPEVDAEVEAVAAELEGKAKLVRVDIEASRQLTAMFRIQTVPTFVVFDRGRPVAMEQGVMSRAQLREMLDPFLPRPAGAIKPAELAGLLSQQPNNIVAVDTRDAGSYGRAHIAGAAHLPLEEIESRLADLHMLGDPVLYCRAGDKSRELSEKLAQSGIGVPYLEGGFLAWEAEMLPIEKG